MTTGLMILSKVPILHSTETAFKAQAFHECIFFSRAVLHCELENGVHLVTTHLSPTAENCGPLRHIAEQAINRVRTAQAEEIVEFISSCTAKESCIILAGDLNLSLQFDTNGAVVPCPSAEEVLSKLRKKCGMYEMTQACRGRRSEGIFNSFRPTCGYVGAAAEGSAPESFLSTFVGDGSPKHVVEDAVLFRGCSPVSIEEVPMPLEAEHRPCKEVTHISDHWAIRSTFRIRG